MGKFLRDSYKNSKHDLLRISIMLIQYFVRIIRDGSIPEYLTFSRKWMYSISAYCTKSKQQGTEAIWNERKLFLTLDMLNLNFLRDMEHFTCLYPYSHFITYRDILWIQEHIFFWMNLLRSLQLKGGIGNTRGLLSQDKWNNRTDTKIELTMMLKFSSFSYF